MLLSLGKRLSSVLFYSAIKSVYSKNNLSDIEVAWLDIRDSIKTDDQFGKAKPLLAEITKNCESKLSDVRTGKKVFVTQGFIGQTLNGVTTTLGRGGSDYSAALLAEGLKANVCEIWTDVAGVATTDPRLFAEAVVLDEISF